PLLTYGLPYPALTAQHAATTFSAKRIYILISGTLARTTDALQRLQDALESHPAADMRVVGVRKGMKSHTYWSEVLEVADDVRRTGADLLVVVGGGSLVDAGKVVGLALANNITTPTTLSTFSTTSTPSPNPEQEIHPSHLPTIAIPTTLSGGEYSNLAGSTNDTTDEKHLFAAGIRGPQLIILDAELCATTTPPRVWLSTGIRAVDHCVETYLQSSSSSGETTGEGEEIEEGADGAVARHGLGLLVPGLLRCCADREGEDVEARLNCLLGSVDAMGACLGGGGGGSGSGGGGRGREGVKLGASHGIGHQLGPLGIPHGETSCILLPAVCKYNALHSTDTSRQNSLRQFLLRQPSISDVLHARHINKDTADLGDVLDAVIRELGLPRSLSEVGVGREKFEEIAEKSVRDVFCRRNPVPVTREEQVVEILEMVV
ncbi:putative Fe-containing alcohol dehydrogenase, partial [Aspergillus campestris IBT 28561]